MKNLIEALKRKDLIGIKGMKTELGFKTNRFRFKTFIECSEWLERSSKNSIELVFENEILSFER